MSRTREELAELARAWIAGDPDPATCAELQALLDEAVRTARELCALRAFAAVKAQLRAATCARLERIVEREEEPMLEQWIEG